MRPLWPAILVLAACKHDPPGDSGPVETDDPHTDVVVDTDSGTGETDVVVDTDTGDPYVPREGGPFVRFSGSGTTDGDGFLEIPIEILGADDAMLVQLFADGGQVGVERLLDPDDAVVVRWEDWNASMPAIPQDATVSLGFSAKDMPQR